MAKLENSMDDSLLATASQSIIIRHLIPPFAAALSAHLAVNLLIHFKNHDVCVHWLDARDEAFLV